MDAVRCRTFLNGLISMFVCDILQIPTGYTPLATGLGSTPYSTPAVEGDGWSTLNPGRFTCGKVTSCALYMRLGRLQNWSGWVRKISPYTGVRNTHHPTPNESLLKLYGLPSE